MEIWELVARESIRDLVARYNASGDSGRVDEVLALFWNDAEMELAGDDGLTLHRGHDAIGSIFTGAAERWQPLAPDVSSGPGKFHVRHRVSTLVIDVVDPASARGYCYFSVVMPHGLDHWGRYFDRYEARDGVWKFTRRRVVREGARALPTPTPPHPTS